MKTIALILMTSLSMAGCAGGLFPANFVIAPHGTATIEVKDSWLAPTHLDMHNSGEGRLRVIAMGDNGLRALYEIAPGGSVRAQLTGFSWLEIQNRSSVPGGVRWNLARPKGLLVTGDIEFGAPPPPERVARSSPAQPLVAPPLPDLQKPGTVIEGETEVAKTPTEPEPVVQVEEVVVVPQGPPEAGNVEDYDEGEFAGGGIGAKKKYHEDGK